MVDDAIVHEYIELMGQLNSSNRVIAFPSIGEYLIYDDFAYMMLVEDCERMAAFEAVIKKSVKGKTVFDIGTGELAVLAKLCIESGAEHVYAVEINETAAAKAANHILKLGLAEHITVIHGDSLHVEFPQKVDVCVAEIIGNIGGAEGAPVILKNALRFLNPGSTFIPEACITRIAPVKAPEKLYADDRLDDLIEYYTAKIHRKTGKDFPLTRQVYYNFPKDHMISKPEVFEEDRYKTIIFPEFSYSYDFVVEKKSTFDGFLLWINLYVDAEYIIDSLDSKGVWGPVFLKTKSIPVEKGDIIHAVCERRLSQNGINPDYFISGTITSNDNKSKGLFSIASPYR